MESRKEKAEKIAISLKESKNLNEDVEKLIKPKEAADLKELILDAIGPDIELLMRFELAVVEAQEKYLKEYVEKAESLSALLDDVIKKVEKDK
ncbi:MAG: hypothetical protein LBN08_00095 [Lactobacillales bacterium]|jgi:hypothetical protein|nr:hypothetical protein [Lactobacillales bacterium]